MFTQNAKQRKAMRSDQNLTSSTTCESFQRVVIFVSGCLTSRRQNCWWMVGLFWASDVSDRWQRLTTFASRCFASSVNAPLLKRNLTWPKKIFFRIWVWGLKKIIFKLKVWPNLRGFWIRDQVWIQYPDNIFFERQSCWPEDIERILQSLTPAVTCLPHRMETFHCLFLLLNVKEGSCVLCLW